MGDIPPSVVRVIAARPELTGPSGTLEPSEVSAGLACAMVTRASYSARLKWIQSLDWWKVSCMLRGLEPGDQDVKAGQKARPGSDALVNRGSFDEQYGSIPVQADHKSCV